ncbi:MAG: hypothetical protein WCG83_04930 [Candidatus Peregrinibacteria bacterium]
MWPFRRREPKKEKGWKKPVQRLIVGLIIGGAIGSIVGRKSEKDEEGKE